MLQLKIHLMVSYGIKIFLVCIVLLNIYVGVKKLECHLTVILVYTNAIKLILDRSAIFLVSYRLI